MSSQARRGIAFTGLAGAAMGALDALATLLLLRFWLTPDEFGLATVAVTLFPLLDLLADGGFSAALVQRRTIDRTLLSSAACAAALCSLLAAALACGLGVGLAALHGDAALRTLLAAYGVRLVLGNLSLVPMALLRRDLQFDVVARLRTTAAVAEFAAKLAAAAAGLGAWCFVVAQLAKGLTLGVLAQAARPFRPAPRLVVAEVRSLSAVGGRTAGSHALFHLYTNADYQVVGAMFGPAAAGVYRAAYELVLEPTKLLSYVVVEVAFPVFARLRDDAAAVRAQFLAFTRQNLWVVLPLLAVMMSAPGELLATCFGAEWRAGADAVRILGVVGALRALGFLVPPLLDGIGRPDLTLRYTICAAVVIPLSQVLAAHALGPTLGWEAVAWAWAAGYPIAFGLLLALALRCIDLRAREYLRAIAAPGVAGIVALTVAMGIARVGPWTEPLPRLAAVTAAVVAAVAVSRAALRRW